ncbi:MAG: SPOR domain-containing protein [Salibacteraceae bacterium]
MEDLNRHVKTLLFDHDCVIIPNFGGFVANPHSAKINTLKSQIDPPFKEIGFNPRLVKNDGLLANHICTEQAITYELALNKIEAVVDEINNTVKSGKTFRLNEIGSFYLDSNKSLRFSADRKSNLDLEFFGFEPISAIPIKKESIEQKSTLSSEIKLEENKPNKIVALKPGRTQVKRGSNWRNIALVAACIPLMLYLLWIPTRVDLKSDSVKFQFSDLNPYTESPCAFYEKRTTISDIIEFKSETDNNIFKELANSNENYLKTSFFEKSSPNFNENELITIELRNFPAEALSTKVIHAFIPTGKTNKYYVIGGCFKEYTNANNFINKLRTQGFNSVLIDRKNSLYRVGIEGANSKDEITHQLDRAKASGHSDAWILRIRS